MSSVTSFVCVIASVMLLASINGSIIRDPYPAFVEKPQATSAVIRDWEKPQATPPIIRDPYLAFVKKPQAIPAVIRDPYSTFVKKPQAISAVIRDTYPAFVEKPQAIFVVIRDTYPAFVEKPQATSAVIRDPYSTFVEEPQATLPADLAVSTTIKSSVKPKELLLRKPRSAFISTACPIGYVKKWKKCVKELTTNPK